MTHPNDREALDTARRLTEAFERTSQRLEENRKASEKRDAENAKRIHETRLFLLIAAVGLVFDITATAVAFVSLDRVGHTSATVESVHDSNLSGCQYNNVRLARQEATISAILQPGPNATKAEITYLARARAKVAVAWAPRDCSRAYGLGPR